MEKKLQKKTQSLQIKLHDAIHSPSNRLIILFVVILGVLPGVTLAVVKLAIAPVIMRTITPLRTIVMASVVDGLAVAVTVLPRLGIGLVLIVPLGLLDGLARACSYGGAS